MGERFDDFLEEWANECSETMIKDLKEQVNNYIWFEANKLAQDVRRRFTESSRLARYLYEQVPLEYVAKNIKKSLPLNVRLFNRIEVTGKSLSEDRIIYTYHFNGDFGYKFKYAATLTELKELIDD